MGWIYELAEKWGLHPSDVARRTTTKQLAEAIGYIRYRNALQQQVVEQARQQREAERERGKHRGRRRR